MPNTTNFNFPTPADTDLVKDGASAIRSLGNSIDTTFAELKGGTTGQVLSKTSNTDMDFTWVAQDDSNAIQNAIVDAKGDLISATAADTPARLAVGTNGQYLKANSSTSTGLEWADISAGGLTLISTTSLTGASSITLSSIPSTYVNLRLFIRAANVATNGSFRFRLNGNTGFAYDWIGIESSNSSATGTYLGGGNDYIKITEIGTSSNYYQSAYADLYIPRYNDTANTYVDVTARSFQSGTYYSHRLIGTFNSSAAISSITLISSGGNFNGGTAYLYGEK